VAQGGECLIGKCGSLGSILYPMRGGREEQVTLPRLEWWGRQSRAQGHSVLQMAEVRGKRVWSEVIRFSGFCFFVSNIIVNSAS
jgi:hypothetical protein